MSAGSAQIVPTSDSFRPAVSVDGVTGEGCTSYSDFCFFCEYALTGDESDPRYELSQLVHGLLDQGANLDRVVNAIYRAYTESVQPVVEWHNPETQKTVTAPAWSKTSIARHLINDGDEFPKVFDNTVDRIIRKVVLELNNTMINADTDRVDLETFKAFREAIDARTKWKARGGLAGKCRRAPKSK